MISHKSNIARINRLTSKQYLEIYLSQSGYIEDGEMCYDIYPDDSGFCLCFQSCDNPNDTLKQHALEIMSHIVEIDHVVSENVKLESDIMSEMALVEVCELEFYILYNGIDTNVQWHAHFEKTGHAQWKYIGMC